MSGAPLRVLDLFSGIGGFSLGLERTGGFRTVAFCEVDPFCQAVLAKHWPEVPCYDDVRYLEDERLCSDGIEFDVITAGFPCVEVSPVSVRRPGLEGRKSGLWSHVARLVREARPRFVLLENSASLPLRGLDRILSHLAVLGYDAEWAGLPASAFGAPHLRARTWVLAYASGDGDGIPQGQIFAGRDLTQHCPWWDAEPNVGRVDDGLSGGSHRRRVLGNAVVPQIAEVMGRCILARASVPVRKFAPTPSAPAATGAEP